MNYGELISLEQKALFPYRYIRQAIAAFYPHFRGLSARSPGKNDSPGLQVTKCQNAFCERERKVLTKGIRKGQQELYRAKSMRGLFLVKQGRIRILS